MWAACPGLLLRRAGGSLVSRYIAPAILDAFNCPYPECGALAHHLIADVMITQPKAIEALYASLPAGQLQGIAKRDT